MAKPGQDKEKDTQTPPPPGSPASAPAGTAAISKKEAGGIVIARPELEGLENLEMGDIKVPQLRLLQGQAPDILAGYGAPGEFINSVTKKKLGRELLFIPICFGGKIRINWKPKEEGGWNCISRDGKKGSMPRVINKNNENEYGACMSCKFKEFGTCTHKDKEHLPACTVIPSYLVTIPGEPFFFGLSFPRTKEKIFRDFSTTLRIAAEEAGAPPIRHKVFKMSTIQESGHGNTWLNYKIEQGGLATEEQKKLSDATYAMIAENFSRLSLDLEEDLDESPAGPGAAADAPGAPSKF